MLEKNIENQLFFWSHKKVEIKEGMIIEDLSEKAIKYNPLEINKNATGNIYKEFISVDVHSEKSIKTFIEKYGFLYSNLFVDESFEKTKGEREAYCESIDSFIEEYTKFKQLAEIFACSNERDEDIKKLLDIIINLKSNLLCISSSIVREQILSSIRKSKKKNKFEEDIKNPIVIKKIKVKAFKIIALQINYQIEEIKNKVRIDEFDLSFKEYWSVKTLIEAMYLMFYFDLVKGRTVRLCANQTCNKYFVIYGFDYRKIYCCENCAKLQTVRNNRKAKKEARLSQTIEHK